MPVEPGDRSPPVSTGSRTRLSPQRRGHSLALVELHETSGVNAATMQSHRCVVPALGANGTNSVGSTAAGRSASPAEASAGGHRRSSAFVAASIAAAAVAIADGVRLAASASTVKIK